jgi:branched-chain amino acid transport system ATP-binding protein
VPERPPCLILLWESTRSHAEVRSEQRSDDCALAADHNSDNDFHHYVKIAEAVRLEDSVNKLPGELNIEELRKLELAMAAALSPAILLIDEMFAGLTTVESGEIIEIIKNLMKAGSPSTVVVIDHNLSALSDIADRVVAIDLGVKVAEGTFEQVCADEKVKRAYLGDYV